MSKETKKNGSILYRMRTSVQPMAEGKLKATLKFLRNEFKSRAWNKSVEDEAKRREEFEKAHTPKKAAAAHA